MQVMIGKLICYSSSMLHELKSGRVLSESFEREATVRKKSEVGCPE